MSTRESTGGFEKVEVHSAGAPTSHPASGHTSTQPQLPAEPLVRIRPRTSRVALDLGDLWAYRELLYFLTWRDIKVRYKQTVLGAAWAILQPLFLMLIFTLLFARVAGLTPDGVPYPLFAFTGLVPWTFFANAVTTSGNSLVGNANLITKVYFPRMLVPLAAVAAGLVDFALSFALLVALLVYYGVRPTWQLALLPALVVLTTLCAAVTGLLLSALNVKYRDIRFALPFLIQLWLFVSSVILPSSVVPERWRWLLALNPMSGIIESYRAVLLGLPLDWMALLTASLTTLVLLLCSVVVFRRMEKQFADII
ncbi:MAG TPA: ABC transporter permease [Pyrinomonadaceae bacterium]|nr:ABC transporter permease [Pyrinomonadaceae bacterium]